MTVKQKATLLVDGEVLKQHILSLGEQHNSQQVLQYLHHMATEIQNQFPDTELCVNYYGVRSAENVAMPISGKKYPDADVKKNMRNATLPNAELKTFWSRMYYPFEEQWVMKPESYNKTKLEDADFRLNEQPKGLLTQLVDAMAEKAVCHRENRLFVYGDMDDMAYAVGTTNGLGMPINQVILEGKKPIVAELSHEQNPTFCPKNILEEVAESLRQPWAEGESLQNCMMWLRGALGEEEKGTILMLDIGGVRKYLAKQGMRTSVQNLENIIHQIEQALPEKPTQTVFYHAVFDENNPQNKFLLPNETPIEIQLRKKDWIIPGVKMSLGKTQQDKNFPTILKKEKWFEHPTTRQKEDFMANIRQFDVDDRIAYDMALARLNPIIKRVYLLSTDGDFAYSVEQAGRAGLPVSLVRLEQGVDSLSARLERGAEDVVQVPVDLSQLSSREEEREAVRQENEKAKRERLKQIRQQKRLNARLDAEDEEEALAGFRISGPSKEERWGRACKSHKTKARKIIAKTRGTYGK